MANTALITLLGNITEPEVKVTPDGTDLISFSLAITTKRRDGEATAWYRCTAWQGTARGLSALADRGLFAKGALVLVNGVLTPREYQANDGSTRLSLDVNARSVELCSAPKGADAGEARQAVRGAGYEAVVPGADDLSEIPF